MKPPVVSALLSCFTIAISSGSPSGRSNAGLFSLAISDGTLPNKPIRARQVQSHEIAQMVEQLRIHYQKQEWPKVIEVADKIVNNLPPQDSVELSLAHYMLGEAHFNLQDFHKAELSGLIALEMRKRIYGEGHLDVAASYNDVGAYLVKLGKLNQALPLLEKGLAMRRRLIIGPHVDSATSLNNTAVCLNRLGRPEEAILLYEEALEMYRALNKNQKADANVVHCLINMSLCLINVGNRDLSLRIAQEAHQTCLDLTGGKDTALLAYSINSLAFSLESNGKKVDALKYFREALEMYRRLTQGKDHPIVAVGINNVARCMRGLGSVGDSLGLLAEARDMFRRVFKGDDPDLAVNLVNLGVGHIEDGDPGRGISFIEEALAMNQRLYPKDHPRVAGSLNFLAKGWEDLNDFTKAQLYRRRWFESVSSRLEALTGLEDSRITSSTYSEFADAVSTLSLSDYRTLYRSLLSFRYRLSRTGLARLVQELIDKDVELSQLRRDHQVSARVANEMVLARTRVQAEFEKARTASDLSYVRYVTALKAKHGAVLRLDPPSLDNLQMELGDGGAAIDIYRRLDRKEPYYLAVVVRRLGQPKFIELGTEQLILREVSNLVHEMNYRSGLRAEPILQRLDALTFGRLDPHLEGVSRVFVATDGIIAQIPLSGLVTGSKKDPKAPGGRRWVYRIEKMRISLVPSILDVAVPGLPLSGSSAVLVGDIDYNAEVAKGQTVKYKALEPIRSKQAGGNRGLDAFGRWPTLAYSQREISALQNTAPFSGATVLNRSMATEDRVLSITSPKYLHLSTHGYFTERKEESSEKGFMSQVSRADDSMLRSGLILAGANHAGKGIPSEKDGWLTAAEASRLKLRGTRLVTLSACSTGRGDVSIGMGVMGLRRAFRTAGAQGVLMSLFDVPDKETQELMVAFYANLSKGDSVPNALHRAQKKMLKKSYSAFRWAAFTYEGAEK